MAAISSRARNQIATKPSQRFETPTVECPRGGDVRKYASAEERAAKNQKTTVRHFGFTEKVYGFPFSTIYLTTQHLCHGIICPPYFRSGRTEYVGNIWSPGPYISEIFGPPRKYLVPLDLPPTKGLDYSDSAGRRHRCLWNAFPPERSRLMKL